MVDWRSSLADDFDVGREHSKNKGENKALPYQPNNYPKNSDC